MGRLALLVRFSAISSPAGVWRLPSGKHTGILTDVETKVNKKIKKFSHRVHREHGAFRQDNRIDKIY